MLLRFPTKWLSEAGDSAVSAIATIQHALARGVEAVYQLEEGEILGEPTPSRKERLGLTRLRGSGRRRWCLVAFG